MEIKQSSVKRLNLENIKMFNYLLLSLKTFFRDWRTPILIIISIVIVLLLTTVVVEYRKIGGFIIVSSSIMSLISLGSINDNIRRSTIQNNIGILGLSKERYYLSQLLFSVMITFIVSYSFWITIAILGQFDIFLIKKNVIQNSIYGKWLVFGNFSGTLIFYTTLISSFVNFSLYFLLSRISRDNKTYIFYVIVLFIFSVIFGGWINSYITIGSLTDTSNVTPGLYVDSTLVPTHFFMLSYINPLYGIGQLGTIITESQRFHSFVNVKWDMNEFVEIFTAQRWGEYGDVTNATDEKVLYLFILLQPLLFILASTSAGYIIAKFRDEKRY